MICFSALLVHKGAKDDVFQTDLSIYLLTINHELLLHQLLGEVIDSSDSSGGNVSRRDTGEGDSGGADTGGRDTGSGDSGSEDTAGNSGGGTVKVKTVEEKILEVGAVKLKTVEIGAAKMKTL